jgi:hypothetical protein
LRESGSAVTAVSSRPPAAAPAGCASPSRCIAGADIFCIDAENTAGSENTLYAAPTAKSAITSSATSGALAFLFNEILMLNLLVK